MLIRFEVENFRSIDSPVELSMVAIDRDREAARPIPRLGESLLTTAGVYGPNASGKSNLLAALAWLRSAVSTSLTRWDDGIPVEPFAFGDGAGRDTSFAVDMAIGGIRFEYLLDLDRSRVSYEALFHYPEGRRRRVFEREGNELTLQRGLGELSATRSLLTSRSLALSIMRRFGEPLTSSFAQSVLGTSVLGSPSGRSLARPRWASRETLRMLDSEAADQTELFHLDSDRDRALALIRLADVGVDDVRIVEVVEEPYLDGKAVATRRPQMMHSISGENFPFDFDRESAGTKTWFSLVGPILRVLDAGSIAVFDELDASLHPTLTAQILRLFQDSSSNPYDAQLIFSSHDTSLLNHLNRDEIWLTQKRGDGSTELGALSDFAGERVRRSQNIERAYLSGRFGALPDVSDPSVLRELGLIG